MTSSIPDGVKPLASLGGFETEKESPLCQGCDGVIRFKLLTPDRIVLVDLETVLQCLRRAQQARQLKELPGGWWNAVQNQYG